MSIPPLDHNPSRLTAAVVAQVTETTPGQAEQQEWLAAKRTFREAACRIFSKTMLQVRTSGVYVIHSVWS